ncbi:DUF748 domain-containing protein [Pontibacter anaerobius]|uniref:DUF748 domain-containing protein n=1 Tax=Pontibacter anaerobius TaxID=2993940 RepID=A0ABT3RCR9_9BACT|nr:DUF748 domain-containing protein [Pontibacter anaerobius]MCX2739218.1 DUF748 domain-containing protein [Pontibacter anaerobius]
MQNDKNQNSNKVKKWLKVVAWVVGVAQLLFIGLFFFTAWLEHKIERMVADQSKGVYKLQVYGLETSPFIGSLSVDSLALTPDFKKWQALSEQGQKVPRTLLNLQASAINLRNFNYAKALFSQDVQLDELKVQQPKLLMTVMRPDTTEEHKPLHETVKGFIKGLKIGRIDVREAGLNYRKGSSSDTLFALRKFDLVVTDYQLDSASFQAKDRAYYAQKYKLMVSEAFYLLSDNLYKATADSILIDTESETILVNSVQLKPTVEPAALARAKGKAVTYQEVEVRQASFKGVDFRAHSRDNSIRVKHLALQKPSLVAFKDKQHFEDKGTKELPHDMVQSIKTSFLIDFLELIDGYIRYAELVPKAVERGHISFHKLNVSITNLSNIPEQISMDNPALVQASTMVMDRAKLELTIRLPLLQENGYHTLEGRIGETNLQVLNPILMPAAFVQVQSGHISRGTFKAELSRNRANGSMLLLYNNLHIELLTKGSGGDQGLGKEVLSFLANKVAIESSNPEVGEEPRTGNITVTRDSQKSVFNYWKECLTSGFFSSMGLKGMAKQ